MKSLALLLITSSLVWSYSPILHHAVRCNKPSLNLVTIPLRVPPRSVHMQLGNSRMFALDKSTLPTTYIPPTTLAAGALLVCAFFYLTWSLVQAGSVRDREHSAVLFDQLKQKINTVGFNWKSSIGSIVKNIISKVTQLKEQLASKFARKRLNSFSLGNWNVCKLVHIKPASEEYSVFRFQLPAHPASRIGLDIGQEIILCLVDAKGRALKQGFFVASAPTAQGYFDVMCKNGGFVSDGAQFTVAMQFMEVGDELAVKAGPRRLSLQATESPVTSMSILAYEEGIVPTVQLLRSVLADPEASVEQLELLWINHSKKDFLLNEQVEELQSQYGADRLRVTRVVDREAGNANTRFGEQARAALSPYTAGRVAVVMAPPAGPTAGDGAVSQAASTHGAVRTKCQQLLAAQGYPAQCVAQLS